MRSGPAHGSNRRNSLGAVIVLAAISGSVFALFFLRQGGLPIAVLAALLVAGMEALLLYWAAGVTSYREAAHAGRDSGEGDSRLRRRASIASHALRERAYSQRIILLELKSLLVDRIGAVKMISRREIRERARADGRELFGSDLLAAVYNDSLMESRGRRLQPLSKARFLELFNSIADEMRRLN